jgi:hypothetical protein
MRSFYFASLVQDLKDLDLASYKDFLLQKSENALESTSAETLVEDEDP